MSFAPDALNGLLAQQMLSNIFSTSSPPPRMMHVGGLRELKSGISQTQGHTQAQALYDLYDVNPCEEVCEDEESPRHLEKKRRLSVDQVRSLEMSFEIESKLEPERKMQLASELGLQPRQVAVWFQNRRARWKTKQLERDYDHLKKEYDAVLFEKHKLEAEVFRLTQELQSAKQNEKAFQQATATTSDCTDGTAVLMIPKTREGELIHNNTTTTDHNNTTTTDHNNNCEEQTMSPSFCSDAASNRKLPVDDIYIQVVKAEEHEEKELSNNYDGFNADLKSEHAIRWEGQLYDYDYLITLDDQQHQGAVCFDWINFYSNGKL